MNERIYSTPRTYGSSTGYDSEMTHVPGMHARLAERIACAMAPAWKQGDYPGYFAATVNEIAATLMLDWEARGWMLPVEPAPKMDRDYGAKRGKAEPDNE